MRRVRAKKPVWIQTVWDGSQTLISVTDEQLPPFGGLKNQEGAHYMRLEEGDLLEFENTLTNQDGYAFMVAHFPQWFEVIEVEEEPPPTP